MFPIISPTPFIATLKARLGGELLPPRFQRPQVGLAHTAVQRLEGHSDNVNTVAFSPPTASRPQVKFILEVERLGTFITKNHYYARALKRLRIERSHNETKKLVANLRIGTSGDGNPREESAILRDHLTQAGSSQSNFEHVIDDMHGILMAYYKVARKRFIDIVIAQAADYYLLTGSKSPLNILTHDFIYEMSKEQREIIAGEDRVSKKKRKDFRDQIDRLKKGKSVIEGLKG